jgi:integrase
MRDICSKNLFDFNKQVAEQYRDERLEETWKPPGSKREAKPISPRTVRWEISHIQLAWKAAKKWPGLSHLENPWQGMRVKGSTGGRRKTGLQEGELERLIESCKGCLGDNRYYVPLAIHLCIDTGMRRQEIFNLTWEDIDFKKNRIWIRKSKTDWKTGNEGIKIILSFQAKQLILDLDHHGYLGSSAKGQIFPMTGKAFTQTFRDVVRRAGLKDITFRSTLRTTANTRFIQAGLTDKELDIMMRHTDKSTNAKFYTDRDAILPQIQEKLERYSLGGKTRKELIAEAIEQHQFRATVEEAIKTNPPS